MSVEKTGNMTAAVELTGAEIAVIGMAGRFPGAKNIDEFRENLKNGIESISFFADEELEAAGVEPGLVKNPDYIKAKGVLQDIDGFDAAFFRYSALEAEMMDPQLRVFHQVVWQALEHAGYEPGADQEPIGLYAGDGFNFYWLAQFVSQLGSSLDTFDVGILNDRDFLCTRISYKLDLKGPSLTVQCACSTSLAAVHQACQGLLSGECGIACAGGVSISLPQNVGYLYQEGLLNSADGHCRAFDARATGMLFGEGAGVVVLKPLENAIADRDHIHAVIKGTAMNNDGSTKIGFTAPGKKGQANVIRMALEVAEVDPASIAYVETHGTGTPIGDPIEIEALQMAFNLKTRGTCRIGSVKTNIGHLDRASGVTGLIKTVLMLEHGFIPPSLNFHQANPNIDFANSPFVVNTCLMEWERGPIPRRAGVSSFGIGGTNAHVVLEEAPRLEPSPASRHYQILRLSARTKTSLEKAVEEFQRFLTANPGLDLADAAYTLQVGRKHFQHRKMVVCSHRDDALAALARREKGKVFGADAGEQIKRVIFMFPGQGSQYVDMALGLYREEKVFREEMDRCFAVFRELMGYDIKKILYPGSMSDLSDRSDLSDPSDSSDRSNLSGHPGIEQTEISQPVIFLLEYALAKLLMSWGIQPEAMIGYSFGEYAAACLAGVLSLEDALRLVAWRGRLMQQLPAGAMLSTPLTARQLQPLLPGTGELAIAIDNGSSTIVSGSLAAIEEFEKKLKAQGVLSVRVSVAHAFHSSGTAAILEEFERQVRQVKPGKIRVPYISNVTGRFITQQEVEDPAYWVRHLQETVRFGDGIAELLKIRDTVWVEVGPGQDLCVLLKNHQDYPAGQRFIDLVRHRKKGVADLEYLLNRVGHLWLYGVDIDGKAFYALEKRTRVPLPTYPFEPQRFPVEAIRSNIAALAGGQGQKSPWTRKSGIDDWVYMLNWKRSKIPGPVENAAPPELVILLAEETGFAAKIEAGLARQGCRAAAVRRGEKFARLQKEVYTVNPGQDRDYQELFSHLQAAGSLPPSFTILHLWGVTPGEEANAGTEEDGLEKEKDNGYYSLIALARVLGGQYSDRQVRVITVTHNAQDVVGGDLLYPGKALLTGPVKVIPQEYGNIRCSLVDLALPQPGSRQEQELVERLLGELEIDSPEHMIAYRNNHRWVQDFEAVTLGPPATGTPGLREKGVYLVSGGLGGIGLILAAHLGHRVKAKLILVGRSAFPERKDWQDWLGSHDPQEPTSVRIRRIQEIEASGAQVLVLSADVSDFGQMRQAVTRASQVFGPINGVIHAAGVPDGAMILRRTRQMSEEILAPKVTGALVLEKLFRDSPLDFMILCSSMASILPLPGQVAYAAANAFLDAFAAVTVLKNGVRPISIDWDRWQNTGIAVIAEEKHQEIWGEELKDGISAAEGAALFDRIAADPHPLTRVVVSPFDAKSISLHRFDGHGFSPVHDTAGDKTPLTPAPAHQRPELSVDYVEPRGELEEKIARIWHELFGIHPVGTRDNFFELGGDSLKGIKFINRYHKLLGEIVHINVIFEAPTIAELALYFSKHYPETAARLSGAEVRAGRDSGEPGDTAAPTRRIDAAVIERIRRSLPVPVLARDPSGQKNPPAVFILSPPRTGSTLLRALLGGHPGLFAPPELNLLSFNTLDEVTTHLQSSIRAVMQIKACGKDEAAALLEELRQQRLPTKQFYHLLQQWLGQRRLVDKTPDYASHLPVLERAEADFADPLYIHLVRHPYGMIRSFEEARMDLFMGERFTSQSGLSRRELAEVIWVISLQNILAFLKNIPPQRQFLLRFEDLVREPKKITAELCRFLGLEYHPGMLALYEDKEKSQKERMTDGIHAEGIMLGDVKFNRHNAIAANVADSWKTHYHDDFLGEVTREIARGFDYKTLDSRPSLTLEPGEKKEYYPASVAQKKFFIINQIEGIHETYNSFRYVTIEGKLDRQRFEAAWQTLIERQESLRTSFHLLHRQPIMRIHDQAEFKVRYVELPSPQDGRIQDLIKTFRTPFDLSRAPLVRVQLVRLESEKHVMLFGMHHIITDGVSNGIAFTELIALYQGTALPPLTLQYRDYARWEQKFLESETCKEQEAYWLEKFSGQVPLLNMPTDWPRPRLQDFDGQWLYFKPDPALIRRLKKLAEETGTTLYMVLLAAFNVVLSRYTTQQDIIVGSPIAGRHREELERIIGVFMNVVPMRNVVKPDQSFAAFLSEIKENVLMAFKNHQYPLGELVEKLAIHKDLSRNPLNDVEFIMMRNELTVSEVDGIRFIPSGFDAGTSPVDLTLSAVETGDEVSFILMYCIKLFKRETMERFIDSFQEILAAAAGNKDILMRDIIVSTGLGEASTVFQAETDTEDFAF